MNMLRSVLFMAVLLLATPLFVTVLLLFFWLPARSRRLFVMPWVNFAMWLVKHLLRIDHRILGAENIPGAPCVILCKHQSAWETLALQQIFPLTSFVMKKNLHWVPFFGWGLALMPFISINRAAGKDALTQVEDQGRRRLGEGYSVVVFPEGTRVAPGHKKRYKAGGAWLAAKSGAPVVPVALNSGEFWRKNAFFKRPGRVTVSIGPAIAPAGLAVGEINRRAEAWIEAEMRRISPHLYRNEDTQSPTRAAA
ncbi:MAG: lysophospholipid acyltransferase family protein [Rhodocyclaceae bacterium]|nr:lysophospholipid acyltransferase family protein [Rhodocyclaceae bacterium]